MNVHNGLHFSVEVYKKYVMCVRGCFRRAVCVRACVRACVYTYTNGNVMDNRFIYVALGFQIIVIINFQ